MSQFTLLQKRAIISVVAAIVVHGLVVFLWILLILWDLPIFSYKTPPVEPEPEPEVTVILRPFIQKPPPVVQPPPPQKPKEKEKTALKPPPPATPKPPAEVKPVDPEKKKGLAEQKRKFARTSEDQAGAPDEPTDLLGERNTLAASEKAPTPGAAPNVPSQDGVNPLFQGQVETVNRDYKDGSVGMDKTGKETETPQEETASRKEGKDIEEVKKTELIEPEKDSTRPKNKHLAQGEKRPVMNEGEIKPKVEEKPKTKELAKERASEGDKENHQGDAVKQKPKKDGFSGHSRKNRVVGSISRRGKSAQNVKNSPVGRYQAQVSKAVELQWRRNCEQYRDHIVPGVISIRFYVDAKGKVSGIRIQEVVEANYIEQGFTQRAIRQVKLPKMPRSVVKELDGDPLELIYNFYF